MKSGDFLIGATGDLAMVVSVENPYDMVMVQFIDQSHVSLVDPISLKRYDNLGNKPELLFAFTAARSIHLRLNKLGQV